MQEDFVSARQHDKDAMSAEDFQTLLVLGRLLAISHGQMSLTKPLWERAKEMEAQRKHRLHSA